MPVQGGAENDGGGRRENRPAFPAYERRFPRIPPSAGPFPARGTPSGGRKSGAAGVRACKVFPHNLRKLFARVFYSVEKDIAKLADVLGHSSINTTRIYIMTTGLEHRRQLERLGLVV